MFKVDTSDFQENVFRKDIAGDTTFGGYPITNLINNKNEETIMLGGSNKIGISRFDGLVVPIGLMLNDTTSNGGCTQLSNIKLVNTGEIINDDLFDKLFNTVKKNNKDNNKTRKIRK